VVAGRGLTAVGRAFATLPPALRARAPEACVALGACLLIAAFAFDGPRGPLAVLAVVLLALVWAFLAAPSLRVWFLPAIMSTVVFGQLIPGVYIFEFATLALLPLLLWATLAARDRAAWNVSLPALYCVCALVIPLLAVPFHVVSMTSFLGAYLFFLTWVTLFLAIRRLVPLEASHIVLWVFPFIGAIGFLQLVFKTRGLGDQLVQRLVFRNFYTELPWGRSDFVSAVMEVVVCACVVLYLLDRRPLARVVIVACGLMAGRSFLVLLSRGGAVGLLLFALVLTIGLGGARGLLAAGMSAILGVVGASTTGGQALLSRFTDPGESASVGMRFVLWATSWSRFLANPWTGVGLNQERYQHDLLAEHWGGNLLLDMLAEQGVFGGLLLIAIFVAAFRMAARAEPYGLVGSPRPVRVAVIGLLVECVFHASVEPTLLGPPMAVPLVALFAWLTLQDPRRRVAAPGRPTSG